MRENSRGGKSRIRTGSSLAGLATIAAIFVIWLAPNAAATSYTWSCNQSSCSWNTGWTGDSTPNNGCSGVGGTTWNHGTPSATTGQVQVFTSTMCGSGGGAVTQSKNVWAGYDSPKFTGFLSSGTYTVTVKYLVLADFAAQVNCAITSSATASFSLYLYVNIYDWTTGSAPISAHDSSTLVNQNAGCSGSPPDSTSAAVDGTYTFTSTGHFTAATYGTDSLSVIGGVLIYANVYSAGSSLIDLQLGSVTGTSDNGYLTYLAVS